MDKKVFDNLLASANDALKHARGARNLRTTVLPQPPEPIKSIDIRRLRRQLAASQSVFARYMNVSTKLVQAWEANRRSPDGAALLLLRMMEQDPEDFLRRLYARSPRKAARTRRITRTKRVAATRSQGREND